MSDLDNSDSEASILYRYDIRFSVERPLMPSEEPDDYVIDIEGDIRFTQSARSRDVVGQISARRLQAGRAYEDGMSLFEICDSVDQSLHDYASAVYDFDEESILESISDGCSGADLLIVESIQILPAHRGNRLGLFAMRRTIDTVGDGCAVVVIKPFPLQYSTARDLSSAQRPEWETQMAMQSFTATEKAGFAKLRKHWAQLGFKRIGRTDYFALDMQVKRPSYEELLR